MGSFRGSDVDPRVTDQGGIAALNACWSAVTHVSRTQLLVIAPIVVHRVRLEVAAVMPEGAWLEPLADFFEASEVILVRVGDNHEIQTGDPCLQILQRRRPARTSAAIYQHVVAV